MFGETNMQFIYHNTIWSSNDSNNIYEGYVGGNSLNYVQESNNFFAWNWDDTELMRLSGNGNLKIQNTMTSCNLTSITGTFSNTLTSNLDAVNIKLVTGSNFNVRLLADSSMSSNYSLTFPNTAPTNSNLILFNNNGVATFIPNILDSFRFGSALQTGVKIWTSNALVSSGRATFYPTSDSTSNGTAFFSTIFFSTAMGASNTTNAINMPFCSLNNITSDKKQVVFNVVRGVMVALGGASLQTSPDGTLVNALVIGV